MPTPFELDAIYTFLDTGDPGPLYTELQKRWTGGGVQDLPTLPPSATPMLPRGFNGDAPARVASPPPVERVGGGGVSRVLLIHTTLPELDAWELGDGAQCFW
jgi:hypothetical protein